MNQAEGEKEPLEAAEAPAPAASAPRERLPSEPAPGEVASFVRRSSPPAAEPLAQRSSRPPPRPGSSPGGELRPVLSPSRPPRPTPSTSPKPATRGGDAAASGEGEAHGGPRPLPPEPEDDTSAVLIPIHAMRVIAIGRDDDDPPAFEPEIREDDIVEEDEGDELTAALHAAALEGSRGLDGIDVAVEVAPDSVPEESLGIEEVVAPSGDFPGAEPAITFEEEVLFDEATPAGGIAVAPLENPAASSVEIPVEAGPPPATPASPVEPSTAASTAPNVVTDDDVETLDDADLALETPKPPPPKAPAKSLPPRPKARSQVPQPPATRRRPWWEHLFGDDFARAYRPLTDAQVKRQVDFIEQSLGLEAGAVVLDLCCGQGQQAVELAARGYGVVGYDLSVFQLALAAENAQAKQLKINFLQGDAREMAFDEMFDAVLCWDTSFGYFEEEKNLNVAERMYKALRPGGVLLLDVLNRDFAAVESPNHVWFEGDGCICMDDVSLDWITSRLRVKRSLILDDGRSREVTYSLRLYSLHELGKLLHDVGFRVTQASGNLATPGVFMGPQSPRIIVRAQKPVKK